MVSSYVRTPGILEKKLDDELLLIDNETDVIFNLNPLGTAVWRFLDTPRQTDEIMAVLGAAFPGVPKEKISEDISRLLGQLVDCKLLVVQKNDLNS